MSARRRLWLGEPYASHALALEMGRGHTGLELRVGGENRVVGLFVGVYFACFWLSLEDYGYAPWRRRVSDWAKARAAVLGCYAYQLDWADEGRATGFSIHDGSIWWRVFAGMDAWSSRGRWPWDGPGWLMCWHVSEWIMGREEYAKGPATTTTLDVKMPEGRYPATVEIYRVTRSDRFRSATRWRASISVTGGIPIPGKGENSWDCDDDATYSITFAERDDEPDPRDVADDMAHDCMGTRQKRASMAWKPRGGFALVSA